jgi:hypothetical protein
VSVRYGTPLYRLGELSKALNLFELVVRTRLGKMTAQRYEKFWKSQKNNLVKSKNSRIFAKTKKKSEK